jgi:hypothetical protein
MHIYLFLFVAVSLGLVSYGFQSAGLGGGGLALNMRKRLPPLQQRVAKNVKGEEATFGKVDRGDDGEEIAVPYQGLAGNTEGRVFNSALQTFDPMEGTDDLPGEDGSDVKINAIQQRIEARVTELKKNGQWGEEGDEYGLDPLKTQNIFVTMGEQVRACKPFESFGDLALTYLLVLATTVLLSTYLISLREGLDGFIGWYEKTDLDALNGLFRNMR